MTRRADPGRVLRRAILAWGLGHLALGQRELGAGLLAAELLSLAILGALVATLVDTTWYLVPFAFGSAFLVAWAVQAVHAYHAAQRHAGALPPAPPRPAAAVAAWLAVPLLLWGTAFWLVAATAATPAAVLDRFVSAWPEADRAHAFAGMSTNPAAVDAAAASAIDDLERRCAAGDLTSDCGDAQANLLRQVRIRVEAASGDRATAVAELVRYERRATQFLGIAAGTELVPVAEAQLVRFTLEARPAPLPGGLELGARRWTIVNAERP